MTQELKKQLIMVVSFLLLTITLRAQQPVRWNIYTKELGTGIYELQFEALLQDGWHIYSQTEPNTKDATATTFHYQKNPLVELEGAVMEEGHLIDFKEGNIEEKHYEHKASFYQRVKLKSRAVKTTVAVVITYQVCTSTMCLPPKETRFTIPLPTTETTSR